MKPEPHAEAPVATLHHLANSGGTLLTRAVAVLADALVLSEVHPDRELAWLYHPFRQMAVGYGALLDDTDRAALDRHFLDEMGVCRCVAARHGRRLVVRDHAQTDFFTHGRRASRLRGLLAERFPVVPVATVRHPLDVYLAMRDNGLHDGAPDAVFDALAAFLDAFADCPVMRYESFVDDPVAALAHLAGLLGLDPAGAPPDRAALEAAMARVDWMTGAGGRRSATVAGRPRREVARFEVLACAKSPVYADLCARLGYAPDPAASPLAQ